MKKLIFVAGMCWFYILVLMPAGALLAQDEREFRLLSDRIRTHLLNRAGKLETVPSLLSNMAKEGSWPDINYADRSSASWQPAIHWDRIRLLSEALNVPGQELYGNQVLLQKVNLAITYWNKRKPASGNYWWMAIGIPIKIGESMLLLQQRIPGEQRKILLDLMKLGIKDSIYDYYGVATGQNLVWLATIHLMKGTLEKDASALVRSFNAIKEEVKISSGEGIQYDYSFHQHGSILYSGGYGLGFSTDIAKLLVWAQGTRYQFPDEKIKIFSSYILDGQQWMLRGHTMDYNTIGREIARSGKPGSRAASLLEICRQLARLEIPRKDEFLVMAARLKGSGDMLTGNRYFPRSDFMVHHTDKLYTSVKMTSSRIKGSESGNKENIKGYYLGQGVQFIYGNGKEYEDIFPVWDWRRLPGHLCEQTSDPFPLLTWGTGSEGKKPFTGGVSDGTCGMAVNDYAWDNVTGKRAWFCFKDEVVCMGAGIYCNTGNALFQSINQSLLKTEVLTGAGINSVKPVMADSGTYSIPDLRWILHDSVAYLFPGLKPITVSNITQSGSWKQINNNPGYTDSLLHKKVFSAWIDLGRNVSNENYLYTIVPGISVREAASYRFPVRVIRNDSLQQAVWHYQSKTAMAAFYEPGILMLNHQLQLEVDKRVLLIIKEQTSGFEVGLSNPENKELVAAVRINKKLKCDNCLWDEKANQTSFNLQMPSGNDAGKTVFKKLMK